MEDTSVLFDRENEMAVLGTMIMKGSPAFSTAISFGVESEWFYFLPHQSIYNTIEKLFQSGSNVDETVLLAAMNGSKTPDINRDYLNKCVDLCTPAHLNSYIIQLKDKWLKRWMQVQSMLCLENIQSGAGTAFDILTDTKFAFGSVSGEMAVQQTPKEALQESIKEFHEAKKKGYTGIPSRWDPLNQTLGGYQNGLIIVAGRTSEGKSTLVQNEISMWIATGTRVALLSFELTKKQILRRLICSRLGINLFEMNMGKATPDQMKEYVKEGHALLKEPLLIEDDVMTFQQARCWLLDHADQYDIAAVDYLQVQKKAKSDPTSRYERLTEWTIGYKQIQKEIQKPLIVISQINRTPATDKKPTFPKLSHLEGTGALEQNSYQVMIVGKDVDCDSDRYHTNMPALVDVAKNADGPTGFTKFTFQKHIGLFEDKVGNL